jgi:recombination protein RecA
MPKELVKFMDELEDRYGEFVVVRPDDDIEVIPTGSLSLDLSIGIGGIPRGKFTEVYGSESTGKTSLALSIAKQTILVLKEPVLYIEAEMGLGFDYIRSIMGEFDESLFNLVTVETAEQAFEIAEEGVKSGLFGLIVVDSLGALSPVKEREDKFTDSNVSLLARALTKFLRRMSFDVKASNVAFLFLNQVRDNIGGYTRSYATPGGHALKHFCAVRVSLTKGKKIEDKPNKELIGIKVPFSVRKNKVAVPFRSSDFPIIFGEGISYKRDVLDFASMLGVIKKAGPYYKMGDDNLGQGMNNAVEYLNKHPETLDKIVEMCYNVLKIERKSMNGKEAE